MTEGRRRSTGHPELDAVIAWENVPAGTGLISALPAPASPAEPVDAVEALRRAYRLVPDRYEPSAR